MNYLIDFGTIEHVVSLFSRDVTTRAKEFSIHGLRVFVAIKTGILLSYKQVRDALYRLREKGFPVAHVGLGVYKWVNS